MTQSELLQIFVFIMITLSVALLTYLQCRKPQNSIDEKKRLLLAGGVFPGFM